MSKQYPDIYARIRKALPAARKAIAHSGIDPDGNDKLIEHLNAGAGYKFPDLHFDDPDVSDASHEALNDYVDGVFVFGMAVGLLLDRTAIAEQPQIAGRAALKTRRRPARQAASSSRPRAKQLAKKGGA